MRTNQPRAEIGKYGLTEATLNRTAIREQLKRVDPNIRLVDEGTHRPAIQAILDRRSERNGIWVFAYGSLIWNPQFHFEDIQPAALRGYHRRYCLWSKWGRGTPHFPGLTLGLVSGGACRGLAYFISEGHALSELELIWRREVVTDAYEPRLVKIAIPSAAVEAVAFVANPASVAYVRRLPEEQIVATLAGAKGELGDCAEYLFLTIAHLNRWAIRDPLLERLKSKVLAEQRTRRADLDGTSP